MTLAGDRTSIMQKDNDANMGIGTIILFISMVLVAAVTASLLISTVNDLQQQAQSTGDEALMDVSMGFSIMSIIGDRHVDSEASAGDQDSIQVLEVRVKLQAGSDPIDMDNVVMSVSDGSTIAEFTLNGSGSTAADADGSTFVATPIRDLDQAYETDHVVGSGDIIKLIVSLDSEAANMPLSTNTQFTVTIQPLHGATSVAKSTTPSVFTTRYVELR